MASVDAFAAVADFVVLVVEPAVVVVVAAKLTW